MGRGHDIRLFLYRPATCFGVERLSECEPRLITFYSRLGAPGESLAAPGDYAVVAQSHFRAVADTCRRVVTVSLCQVADRMWQRVRLRRWSR